jgi:hypothetical protein
MWTRVDVAGGMLDLVSWHIPVINGQGQHHGCSTSRPMPLHRSSHVPRTDLGSQIGQVVLDLLLTQLPKPRPDCMVDTLETQQMIRWIANYTDLDGVAVHLTFNGLLECQ